MNHETLETLAAAYAVGALDGEDLLRFEAHLTEGCAQCEVSLRESRETLARLAASEPRAIPPAHVRQALVKRLAVTDPRRARSSPWLGWALGTAAAVIIASALTAAWVATRYEARLGQMARELSATRERLTAGEAALRDQLAAYAGAMELLRDPATRVVTLSGVGPSPAALGRVIWNETSGGHVFVANLPPAPPGKVYEMWTIAGGTPRAAGLFDVDATGKGSHRFPASAGVKSVEVFAVTLEPAGGADAPTGPIVLASK